jgi:hypothetical protein
MASASFSIELSHFPFLRQVSSDTVGVESTLDLEQQTSINLAQASFQNFISAATRFLGYDDPPQGIKFLKLTDFSQPSYRLIIEGVATFSRCCLVAEI